MQHYNNNNNNSNTSTAKIKDTHFIIGWSLSDEEKIARYTDRLISMYGKPELAEEYSRLADIILDLLRRRQNDHYNATAELGHDWLKVDPQQTITGDDMVTFIGLNKLLKIYAGTASGVFKWVGRGTAASTPTPYSAGLNSETGSRQDATTTGFHDIKGASLRVFSSYPDTVASVTMHQIGIFDASSSGNMLSIHDFGGNGYSHTQSIDSFSLGTIVDFIPFGDV